MNHVVYFPSVRVLNNVKMYTDLAQLPDTFQKQYKEIFGKAAQDHELRMCKVELLQAIWYLVLSDDKFIEGYRNGYVKQCADGIVRHLFYRFFCYSTDYVEKWVHLVVVIKLFRNAHHR